MFTPLRGLLLMKLEIIYLYKEDKHSQETQHYAYYDSKSDDFSVAVKEAGKYFTKLTRESGWTKKTTLKSICLLTNENTLMDVVRVKPIPSKPRRSRASPQRSRPKT